MPPLRTIPVKPVKTERTHEENQERAYIAASRRSDRSLEARVESARRASEIHKKRTGRSLRVTEEDVINEEMYEEEDDDIPHAYRRLNHLATTGTYLENRLHSYLVNQVAMRTMVGQAVQKAWTANAMYPQAMHSPGLISSPGAALPQQNQNQNPQNMNAMGPPLNRRASSNFRQAPYPMPTRVPSQSTLQSSGSAAEQRSLLDRRMSMPAYSMAQPESTTGTFSPATIQSNSSNEAMSSPLTTTFSPQPLQNGSDNMFNSNFSNMSQMQSMGPLTMTLPLESQQLLAGADLDWSDPMMSMMMPTPQQQQFNPQMPNYSYNGVKSEFTTNDSQKGLQQTLAPSFMNESLAQGNDDFDFSAMRMNYNGNPGEFPDFGGLGNDTNSFLPHGDEGEFEFINDSVWGEQSVS